MNNYHLLRNKTGESGTFGTWLVGEQKFVTVERPKTGEHPCIPCGTYIFNRFKSPHNGDCWLAENVPGRSMIEIHSANKASQLLGCIAPGLVLGTLDGVPAVLHSHDAMDLLHENLPDTFSLTISEAF